MPLLAAEPVRVLPEQREALEQLVRTHSTPQQLAMRARLILHAADAMGGRGRLLLRTHREGDSAVVDVCDDGPGMPDAVQSQAFDAFFTTKAPGEGSGLGLDSARRIVEKRHHGRLSFTTGADGTTFEVRLPLVQQLA